VPYRRGVLTPEERKLQRFEPAQRNPEPEPDQQERQRRRWITAIHESAHAGAFFSIGDTVCGVQIGGRDQRYAGTCRTARGRSSDADQIMALLSGEASETFFSD
jgi:hypothetical protein